MKNGPPRAGFFTSISSEGCPLLPSITLWRTDRIAIEQCPSFAMLATNKQE